jgi:hypothetical protein
VTVRPTTDIARRLLAGEALTAAQCADDYGCSTALLGAVIRSLQDEQGCTFTRTPISGGRMLYQLATPAPSGAAHGKGRGVVKMAGRGPKPLKPAKPARVPARSSALPERVRVNGRAMPTTALPSLGADVQVCLLAITEDGRISVGLRTPSGTWLTSVDGFSAADT